MGGCVQALNVEEGMARVTEKEEKGSEDKLHTVAKGYVRSS